jgi:hypothetical protein
METMAIGVVGLGLGLTRSLGAKARIRLMTAKDKSMLAIAVLILVASFTLIAFGRNTTECFGLIGLVVGHFFGREMGKSECPPTDKNSIQ